MVAGHDHGYRNATACSERSPTSAAESMQNSPSTQHISSPPEPSSLRNLPTDNGIARALRPGGHRDHPDRADLRRQSPRLDAVRPVRAEPRADRAPARRGRGLARQPGHDRGLARRLRARAPRARRSLRADQARPRRRAGRRRGRDPPRDRARLAVRFRSRDLARRRSRRSTCASARCARAPPGRTPISARSSATSSCSASARPAPARPGSRSRYAVALFERKEVDRIMLSRPAVEAGERLGFLPGDMREKVDPYLRPIYDALFDLMDARIVERAMQSGEIEIAPLAFMRGRTLSNAVVILDEAQNTTSMQMKMFLTRLGENGRMIVTGDPSQTDLPPGQTSGLSEAIRLLADVEGIGHVAFTADDVVRHELVARIVQAYDKAAAGQTRRRQMSMRVAGDRCRSSRRRCWECRRRGGGAARARRGRDRARRGLPQPRRRAAADRRCGGAPAQRAMARHRQADQRAVVSAARRGGAGDVEIARRHRDRLRDHRARSAGRGQAVRRPSGASLRAWISPSDGLRSRIGGAGGDDGAARARDPRAARRADPYLTHANHGSDVNGHA